MANNQVPKVLIFSTAYFPLIGGAEVAVKEITDRVKDWRFDMITARIRPNLVRFERIGNVNIYRIGFGISFDKFLLPFLGLLKAFKLDKKKNYRIIWSIMASQAGVAAAFFKFFYPRKKLLLTLQEGDTEEHLERYVWRNKFLYNFLVKPWHLLPFKKADQITAISSYLKKRALKNLRNGAKVPVTIIPNGVDTELFRRTSEEEIKKLKSELGLREDERIILTVSRLVKKNGIDDLIKAGKYLDFNFKILIIGQGKDKKKLTRLTKNLNLKEKVLFLGHVDYRDLSRYYSAADVFVRPSLSEGFGNVFLEALACRTPIIGTPVGGITDFLADKGTGLFCQVRNPENISEKIKEILENESLRKTLAVNGIRFLRNTYQWDTIAIRMEVVFQGKMQL